VFLRSVLISTTLLFSSASAVFASEPNVDSSMSTWFRDFKQQATEQELYQFVHALPKGGDLHHHLSGSAFSEWWWELATSPALNGGYEYYTRTSLTLCDGYDADPFALSAPYLLFKNLQKTSYDALSSCEKKGYKKLTSLTKEEKQAWLNSIRLDRPSEGRDAFFQTHWQRLNELFRNPTILGELLIKNMQAYAAENVQYFETQTGVHGMLNPDGTVMDPEAALAILDAAIHSERGEETGVTVKFQYALVRFLPNVEELLKDRYAFVDAHREHYVGINLVGREDNDKGYPRRFLPVFRELRLNLPGVPLSIHAGEVDEPNQHVRDTLLMGADRIGHGLNTITDPDTLLLMRHGPYLIEINLISNLLLEYVDDYANHPFGEYLRLGIPVALSSDDRGMWDSTLSDEFFVAVSEFNLSWNELRTVITNSISHSFLPEAEKARELSKLNAALNRFAEARLKKQALPDFRAPHQFICRFKPAVCSTTRKTE